MRQDKHFLDHNKGFSSQNINLAVSYVLFLVLHNIIIKSKTLDTAIVK